jgi:hypothetical protein
MKEIAFKKDINKDDAQKDQKLLQKRKSVVVGSIMHMHD